MEFEDLGDPIIHLILSKLDSQDKARFACVNTHFRVWASDESLWSVHWSDDICLSAPADPFGSPVPSSRVAYQLWRKEFSMYPWPLVKRAIKCCEKLKSWLKIKHPAVVETLQRGATEDELNECEESLGLKLPTPSRVLYRIFNGQDLKTDRLFGLIGGYCVYEELTNVYMLSIKEVRRKTEQLRRQKWWPTTSEYLVVALCVFSGKVFFLNCRSGQLYVGTLNLIKDGEMMPCIPDNNDGVQDGLLLWLEEHGHRLQNGIVGVREEGLLKNINLFPELPPLCSTSITNGVKVRASAVFVPERTHDEKTYMFAYSIRLSLVPEGCTLHGMRHNSCQLHWRHWVIREKDTVVHDVNGEAVIGKYPLLIAGGKEFVYESRCTLNSVPGSIEGSFTFVPGSLSDPKGDEFEVQVARFSLDVPDYIF